MTARIEARFEKRFPGGMVIEADWNQPAESFSVTVLLGPSGCGKTTTLRCLAGLARPDSGFIRWGNDGWFDADRRIHLLPQERGVGYCFQDYALFPHLTVRRNVGYGLHGLATTERNRHVENILDLFQIAELGERYPHQISGGQQQRVALARTMVSSPRLLLLDEPLSALDDATRIQIRSELRHLLSTLRVPTLVVTHDRVEAMALADQIIVLDKGKVRQQGSVTEIFCRPVDLATARIVGTETVQPGRIQSVHDGLATVAVGSVQLTALAPGEPAKEVYVCIRAEEVTLQKGHPEQTSARNRLPGTIRSWNHEGPMVRLMLDCGFPLAALVTRPAWEELGLTEGSQVMALLKVPAIHLITRDEHAST